MSERHVSMLRGLRINCIMAPLVLCVLMLCGVAWTWWQSAAAKNAQAQEQLVSIARLYALLCERAAPGTAQGCCPDLEAWLQMHRPALRAATKLMWDGQALRVVASIGPIGFNPEQPLPALIEAVSRDAAMQAGPDLAVAPLHDSNGKITGIICVRREPPSPPDFMVLLGIGLTMCAFSIIAAWYLFRRVWLPVESLQRVAEDALAGRSSSPALVSDETGPLHSSILRLAEHALDTTRRTDPKTKQPSSAPSSPSVNPLPREP